MDGLRNSKQMEWMGMDARTSISIHPFHLTKSVEWIATLFLNLQLPRGILVLLIIFEQYVTSEYFLHVCSVG
ncbi:hypothetical protein LIPSTDRAFT_277305 [Lipomyces starkeyi NRRL Y-11557]|uniref:Uncharacterized protein n=1 Tax=Lipomyces starkeyi NRRL Y-11557 TaxID=675824 RepID=A0A1E3Q5F2_LIPST|nr:hypothetical protein LIPSTDRAFT_277305 [Lipomyces starkeyi NRRL Y-11557]